MSNDEQRQHPADAFLAGRPGAPGGEPDVRNGRYHLPDPETGEARTWTRASNVGAVLADRFGLERWARRRLLAGLGERPDLLTLLSAMVEYDPAKLDEVAETALQVAATTEAANLGTAIHEVHARVDRGLEVPEELGLYADGYRAALERAGLTSVVREARVINRALGVAGRLDAIYREADGTLVVGDTKSTDHLQLAAPEIAAQLAAYATADWIELDDAEGRPKRWTPMGPVRRDYAVALHISRETGAVAVYRIDLYLGAHGCNLSTQVREYRKLGRSILLPYVPREQRVSVPASMVGHSVPAIEDQLRAVGPQLMVGETRPSAGPRTVPAAESDDRTRRWEEVANASVIPGTGTQVAEPSALAKLVQPEMDAAAEAARSRLTVYADGRAAMHVATSEHPGHLVNPSGPKLLTAAQLTKMSKAQVQQYMREHGIGDDLAHQKGKLIEQAGRRGKVAGVTGRDTDSTPPANMPPAAPDPEDPHGPAFPATAAKMVASAKSVSELAAVHRWVVRRGGDQAWTDELAELARQRAGELDAASPDHAVLARVSACQSQEEIAALWSELTVGGSRPEGWSTDVDAAARERLRQIEAARPPAPSNPFGPAS